MVRIEHDKSRVRVVFQQRTEHHTLAGDFLIIAIPFSVLRRRDLSPRFSAEKQKVIGRVWQRATSTQAWPLLEFRYSYSDACFAPTKEGTSIGKG